MEPDATHLDGNVAGGELGALFPFEMTTALVRCAQCGTPEPIGAQLAYATAIGTVLRCVHCEAALLSIVRGRDGIWLTMRGISWIKVHEAAGNA
jgi:Zn finger protein HypA/HybF involved in hydrogenase expression